MIASDRCEWIGDLDWRTQWVERFVRVAEVRAVSVGVDAEDTKYAWL